MMCLLLFLLVSVTLVIVLIIKSQSKQGIRSDDLPRGRPGPWRQQVRVQLAVDGFWLHAPKVPLGYVIHYRYWAGATRHTGSVAVIHGPRGAFVYTGDPPSQVEVLDVLPPDQADFAANDYDVLPAGQAIPVDNDYDVLPAGQAIPAANDYDVLPPGQAVPAANDYDVLPRGQAVPADNDYEAGAGGVFASPRAPRQDAPEAPPPAATAEPFSGPPPAY